MQQYNILQAPIQKQQQPSPSPTKKQPLIQITLPDNQGQKEELGHLCSLLSQSKLSLLKEVLSSLKLKSTQLAATAATSNGLAGEGRNWFDQASYILEQLKQHKPHSAPFLMRVNKREAPDYYDIIKEPMDLGTMVRKLRQRQYQSRADFVYDLELIWDNCMFYNSDPRSVYRQHASAMKELSEKLLEALPELPLTMNGSIPTEDDDDSQASQAGDVDMKSNSNQASVDLLASSLTRFENFGTVQQPLTKINEDQVLMEVDNNGVAQENDVDDQPNELVKNLQQKMYSQFHTKSLERTTAGMLDYEIHTQLNSPDFWPEHSHFCNSYPDVSLPVDFNQDADFVEHIEPSGQYGESMNLLRRCKLMETSLEDKLKQIFNQQTYKPQIIQEPALFESRLPNIKASSRRSLALIAGRAGYDGASASALEILDDVYKQYIIRIGQRLRRCCDVYSRNNVSKIEGQQILESFLSRDAHVVPFDLYKFISSPNQRLQKLLRIRDWLSNYTELSQSGDHERVQALAVTWQQAESQNDTSVPEGKYEPAADFESVRSLDGIIGLMHPFIKAKLQNSSVVSEESPSKQSKKSGKNSSMGGGGSGSNVKKQ